jgi:cation diffusion facilitator CzcD-associated flavoprotein CzcO
VSTSPRDARDDLLDYDVVVVGAGFAGLYALYRLRECGFRVHVIEAGDGIGGTWFWNRYPGARVDVQSIEYSYSFSREIEQEWNWTELMPTQPEVEAYINFVADRLDLRRDIQLSSRVTALRYDQSSATWTTETSTGDRYRSRHVVAATGCLSAPLEPDIPGIRTFAGATLYTNRFPREGFNFFGRRVAVVGTGSSGVQCIPEIARQALHVTVFQRSAAYTRPAGCRPLEPGELEDLKANYDDIRRRQRESFAGLISFGAVSLEGMVPPKEKILETPVNERLAKLDAMGWDALTAWADVAVDIDANRAATELYGVLIQRAVKDPHTARALTPDYPMGCKRPIIDTDYFETFNRPNVTLVDLREGPITTVTPSGIETEQGNFDFDVIVWATGFDAMTGALNRIEITGRDGHLLRDVWTSEGAVSYLGLQVAGFPNLFTITGPGSPSVLANMLFGIEQHVDWIADCLLYMRERNLLAIEATEEAQTEWVGHVASLVAGSIRSHETCNSWYLGANIPGKKRVYMPYVGGQPAYRQKCEEIVEAGYEGFEFTALAG